MPDVVNRKSFPDHVWAVLKERYENTPADAMFHLEKADKELKKSWEDVKDGSEKPMKANKVSELIAQCITEKTFPELPLDFSGVVKRVPVFEERDGHWYLTDERKDVPFFRKRGNLTMYRRTAAPFPE